MDEQVRDNAMDQLAGVMYENLFIFENVNMEFQARHISDSVLP